MFRSILSVFKDRENGNKGLHCEIFKRNVQEHRLSAMRTRHQLELGSDSTYGIMAFPEKGVILVVTKSSVFFLYIDQLVDEKSDHSWTISSVFRRFESLKPAKIEDICSTVINVGNEEYEYFMFVQNIFIGGEAHLKPIPSKTDVISPRRISRGSFYFPRRAVWSCDWNSSKRLFAFGGEHFVCLDGIDQRNRVTIPIEGNVHSVTFDTEGKILYCGSHKGEVQIIDVRTGKRPVAKFHVASGITKMALFCGESKMVASCFDHSLAQVDLRKNKVRFFYPEHYNKHLKIPISLSETSDTLCAVGQDEVIRFWSLNSGDFLYYLKPNNGYQPYAWYSEQWCANSYPKLNAKGVAAVAGSSVYLLDL